MDTHPRVSSSEYFKYGVVVLAWRMKRGRLAARGCGRKSGEVPAEGYSFRVRVSVAQTLDDACVDGTFSARRAETPDAWRRFNGRFNAAGMSRMQRKAHKEATKITKTQKTRETVSCLPPAAAWRARAPRRTAPKRTHGTHANSAHSLSPTAASLALSSAATLITTTGDEEWWTQ